MLDSFDLFRLESYISYHVKLDAKKQLTKVTQSPKPESFWKNSIVILKLFFWKVCVCVSVYSNECVCLCEGSAHCLVTSQ